MPDILCRSHRPISAKTTHSDHRCFPLIYKRRCPCNYTTLVDPLGKLGMTRNSLVQRLKDWPTHTPHPHSTTSGSTIFPEFLSGTALCSSPHPMLSICCHNQPERVPTPSYLDLHSCYLVSVPNIHTIPLSFPPRCLASCRGKCSQRKHRLDILHHSTKARAKFWPLSWWGTPRSPNTNWNSTNSLAGREYTSRRTSGNPRTYKPVRTPLRISLHFLPNTAGLRRR